MKSLNSKGKWAAGLSMFLVCFAAQGWSQPQEVVPIYRITVVERSIPAINYRHRGGSTTIDFKGTHLLPEARGEAKVESKQGYIEIEVEFDDLQPATRFGPEYLTYVMWAISPEGRATNLGEVLLNGTKSKLNVTTELQAFGLTITAEPYFAVTQPSNLVVLENVVRSDTRGQVGLVEAKYELLETGHYTTQVEPAKLIPLQLNPKVPLELYEAQNAVRIAQWMGAQQYAGDSFRKAETLLLQAEADYQQKRDKKRVVMAAREAVQTAEDARLIALKRIAAEQAEMERRAAADREAQARAQEAQARVQAAEEARLRAQAETENRLQLERRIQAEAEQRIEAERRARAEADRAAALAQQQATQMEMERARLAADAAERERLRAEQEAADLRDNLRQQLNLILETRDSARGLIVNMSDVLFDTARYTLRPGAREKLAKVAGIVLSHPGLRLEVEGHTDSVGSEDYNQRLSEQRAASVRDFLVQQGISTTSIIARGFGEGMPVATNDTAEGRQQNRRVELVVSGEIIGSEVGSLMRTP